MSEAGFDFGLEEKLKYAAVGVATAALTALTAVFAKNFITEHPAASILLILAFIPAFLPFNKVAVPYMKRFAGKYLFVIVPSILITIGILSMTKYFVLAFLLFIHAAMSVFLRVLKKNHIGVEIITLITVLSGIAYGPKIGAIMGAASMITDYVFSGRMSYFCIITIPTYAAIGAISGAFSPASVVMLGITMTIAYNLFTWIFIMGFMGGHIDKCLRFGITDLAFNTLVFSAFAPTLLAIMA